MLAACRKGARVNSRELGHGPGLYVASACKCNDLRSAPTLTKVLYGSHKPQDSPTRQTHEEELGTTAQAKEGGGKRAKPRGVRGPEIENSSATATLHYL